MLLCQFMTLMFTTIGSAADYGNFGRWLLLTLTVVCWGAQFGSMGLLGMDAFSIRVAGFSLPDFQRTETMARFVHEILAIVVELR
jgi:hypothetical protein